MVHTDPKSFCVAESCSSDNMEYELGDTAFSINLIVYQQWDLGYFI